MIRRYRKRSIFERNVSIDGANGERVSCACGTIHSCTDALCSLQKVVESNTAFKEYLISDSVLCVIVHKVSVHIVR